MSSGRIVYSSVGSTGGYHLGNANQKLTKKSSPEDAVPHNGVSYADLQKRCLRRGELFEDPDFPAVSTSLFYSREPPVPFVWKRPQVGLAAILFFICCLYILFHLLIACCMVISKC